MLLLTAKPYYPPEGAVKIVTVRHNNCTGLAALKYDALVF
jgi:hypothetical protein